MVEMDKRFPIVPETIPRAEWPVAEKTIPMDDMIVGATYRGEGRNFDEGIWNGIAFIGLRHKFGGKFEDLELHYDVCTHYGTFMPFEVIEYPATLYGDLVRLRDACRVLGAAIKEAAIRDWKWLLRMPK